jgi:kalirin
VEDLKGTTAVLGWDSDVGGGLGTVHYTVECCRLTDRSSNAWTVVNRNVADGMCVVQDLEPGETYTFRITCHRTSSTFSDDSATEQSEPSLPSNPLTVPPSSAEQHRMMGDGNNPLLKRNSMHDLDACWQRDFERQYIELEELGRGRFSVVRRCQQILTGAEVAVKFVNRKRRLREETRKEYELILRADGGSGGSVVETGGLFATLSSDAIVLNL